MSGPFITRSVKREDGESGFVCGQHALDDFFARHANGNDAAGIGKTFVLPGGASEPPVRGFYTLSMAEVSATAVGSVLKSKLPRYPLPVALIGRLAVHSGAQGRGVGGQLLGDALRRICGIADQVGCIGILVDAKDKAALDFYLRFGFAPLADEGWPRRMFLPMTLVMQANS